MSEKTLAFWPYLQGVFSGHPPAYAFLSHITEVLHLWDDLIDKDKPVTDADINLGMFRLLIEIPRNPFYQQHFAELNGLLHQAIINWRVATLVERDPDADERELCAAFILRSSYVDLIAASLVIVFGLEKAIPIIRELRQEVHSEGFVGYREALRVEKEKRDELQSV